jgi:hypothetical protein
MHPVWPIAAARLARRPCAMVTFTRGRDDRYDRK